MKITRLACAALVGAVLLAAVGLAQYPPTPPIPRPPAQRPYAPPGEARLEHLTKALNLTEDQQTQIKQILETQSQANENWRKEHGQELRDLHQQVQKARQENDTEALKAATQKFRELFKDRREAEKNVRDQIAAVLNDEQKKKFNKIYSLRRRPGQQQPARLTGRRLLGLLRQLDLTDEQNEQVRTIIKAAREQAAKVEDPKAKAKIWTEAFEKIRDTVLTDEQGKKLAKLRRRFLLHHPRLWRLIALGRELELTDEQKEQIQEILGDAHKKIRDEVLTDEQRAKLKELLANPPKPPQPRGPKPGKAGPGGGQAIPYQKPEKVD